MTELYMLGLIKPMACTPLWHVSTATFCSKHDYCNQFCVTIDLPAGLRGTKKAEKN